MKTKLTSFVSITALLTCGLFVGFPHSFPISEARADEVLKISYTPDETDALAYAAKAQLHVQQSGHAIEDKFLAHHIVQLVRDSAVQGKRIDFIELMREANQFKDESSKELRVATGELKVVDMKEAADRFYAIFDHLPLLGDYISGFHAANNLMSELYSSSIISNNQIMAQVQRAQRIQSVNEIGDDVYAKLQGLARNVPHMDIVVDGVFSHDFGDVSVHDSAQNIRDEDPGLSANLILRENLGADGRLNVDLKRVKQAFSELSQSLLTEFHQINGGIKELRAQTDTKNISEKETKDRQASAEAQQLQEAIQLDNLRAGMSLYCQLISKFDPKNGQILSSTVQAGFDMAQSLSRYKQSMATLNSALPGSKALSSTSTFRLTTDLVQIGLSLVNSLFSSGPSADQIILDQISTVQTMIKELSQAMQENFVQVDGKLSDVLKKLDEQMSKLTEIDYESKASRSEIAEIQRALLSQEAQLDVLEADILRTLQRSFIAEIDRKNQKFCLESDSYTSANFMPYADYRGCVDEFASYASRPAHDLEAPSFITAGPLGTNIGTLSKLAMQRGNYAMLPSKADKLVDPIAWSIGSTAYLKLLEARPEFAHLTSTRAIQDMLSDGNELLQTLQGITVLQDGKGGLISNAPFLLGLVDTYLSQVTEVQKAIDKQKNLYQSNPDQGTHGYTLWPEKTDEVTLQFGKKIPRCGDNSSKMPLLAPKSLNESLPAEVRALQQLTGKGLEVCYDLHPMKTRTGDVRAMQMTNDVFVGTIAKLGIDLIASYDGERIYSRHAETVEIGAGTTSDPDSVLADNMSAVLSDSPAIDFIVAANCHYRGLSEFGEIISKQEKPSPDCLYGKFLQADLFRQLESPQNDAVSADEKAATLTHVRAKLAESLSKHRSRFRVALIDKIKRSDDIQQSLKALEESANSIIAYVKLGLPKSLAESDALRASIFGKNKLLGSSDIARLIESDSSGEEIGQLSETLTSRAALLRNQLAELLKSPTVETQPLIEDTMNRLKIALAAQTKALPHVSMDEAWNDLRSAVSSIR
ncbi:MAG: hypothetical protein ACJ763_17455 [Bdellovibrionia bacterium]